MNRNRSYNPIFVFVVILLMGVVFIEYGRTFWGKDSGTYSRNEFVTDVEAGKVSEVVIMPNAETPTGSVKVTFSDSRNDAVFYTTDVTEVEDLVVGKDIKVEVKE